LSSDLELQMEGDLSGLIITAQKMDVGLVNMRISPASLRVDTDNKGSVFYVDFNEPSAGSITVSNSYSPDTQSLASTVHGDEVLYLIHLTM